MSTYYIQKKDNKRGALKLRKLTLNVVSLRKSLRDLLKCIYTFYDFPHIIYQIEHN